jgi:putative phage-type endonuclease
MEQRTPEWKAARVGKVTASRVADIVARTKKGEYTAARRNYLAQLLTERLTGTWSDVYVSPEMRWGTQQEPFARRHYAFERDALIAQVGLIDHPRIAMAAASPDGLVEDDGLVEIKCPLTATHLQTLQSGAVPEECLPQIAWQMSATGRQWCDFVSYDPRLPMDMRMFVRRVEREETTIAALESEVIVFLAELDATIMAAREAAERAIAA